MRTELSDIASVAESSSASTEQVSASAQQTSATTQEIAASAQELADQAAAARPARRPVRAALLNLAVRAFAAQPANARRYAVGVVRTARRKCLRRFAAVPNPHA